MASLRKTVGLCSLLALLGGCGDGFRKPYYSFELMNRSGVTVTRCDLRWGTYERIGFGQERSANGGAIFGFATYALPRTAVLTWGTEDGKSHRVETHVPQVPRARLHDVRFYFVILPDQSVKVGAFSAQERYEEKKDLELARNGGPAYSVGTKNATRGPLTGITVRFGSYKVNGDENIGLNDANAGWRFTVGLPYQITDTAVVQWTTPDGVKHIQEVALKPQLPQELDDVTIAFIFAPDQIVHVKALPWAERERWMRLSLADLLAEQLPRGR